MEYIILICLVALIILLSAGPERRKAVGSKRRAQTPTAGPDILGAIKPIRKKKSNTVTEGRSDHNLERAYIFMPLNDEASDVYVDWDAEEEEFRHFAQQGEPGGYATGVTFEELSAVQLVIGAERPTAAMVQAAATVRKIEGTDLLALLENALGDSAQKLALLLDKPAPFHSATDTSFRNTTDGFTIEDYI